MRAKAVAERAVVQSRLASTVFAPSLIYAPNDPYVTLLERMSLLPVMPIPGDGTARFAPIWSEDVADCVLATLPGGPAEPEASRARAMSWRDPMSSPTARSSSSCSPRRTADGGVGS